VVCAFVFFDRDGQKPGHHTALPFDKPDCPIYCAAGFHPLIHQQNPCAGAKGGLAHLHLLSAARVIAKTYLISIDA